MTGNSLTHNLQPTKTSTFRARAQLQRATQPIRVTALCWVLKPPVYRTPRVTREGLKPVLWEDAGHRVGIPPRRPPLRLTARRVKPARGRTHPPITDLSSALPCISDLVTVATVQGFLFLSYTVAVRAGF